VLGAVTASFLVPDGERPVLAFTGDAVVAALVAEFVLAFSLAWVVLHVATVKQTADNSHCALAIAAVVVAGISQRGHQRGGVVDPAVAVSLAMMGVVCCTAAPPLVEAADRWTPRRAGTRSHTEFRS
jgi:aquaporin Z